MEFSAEFSKRVQETEAVIREFLPEADGHAKTVIEAMNYSFLAGGKRLRPLLMRETARLFEEETDSIGAFMAAIEMIHTYSLIHDDLPAMDDDDYRRGKKTTHIVYGEAMAILAGDGLLNFAYETAADAVCAAAHPERAARALSILSRSAGIYGMVGGQSLDVQTEGQTLTEEQLDYIYDKKTGALLTAAMEIGAVLAGADSAQQAAVRQAAGDIGLAFQIQDDILDVEGDEALIGKPVGSDEKNQKFTYVTLRGLDAAKADVERLSRRAAGTIQTLPGDASFLTALIRYMAKRDH